MIAVLFARCKKAFSYYGYAILVAGAIIAAIIIFAPRPEGGYPDDHVLSIVTWSVFKAGFIWLAITLAGMVIETVVSILAPLVRWVIGTGQEPSETTHATLVRGASA